MKKNLKYWWACLWYHSRLAWLYIRLRDIISGKKHGVILMFHRVVPGEMNSRVCSLPEIVVFQDTFDRQLRFLSRYYNVVSLDYFVEAVKNGKDLPSRTAVITFDDGWEDNYLYAFPVLKKYGMPATVFLTTGFIGTDRMFWQEKILFLLGNVLRSPEILKRCFLSNNLAGFDALIESMADSADINASRLELITRLKRVDETVIAGLIESLASASGNPEFPSGANGFLSWQQAKEMTRFAVNSGSHGINHRLMDMSAEEHINEELLQSKEQIEHELGMPVKNFAYPNGNYNEQVIRLLREAGYVSGVTVEEGLNTLATDPYRLKRINICEGRFLDPKGQFSEERFAAYLAGLL